MEIELLEVLEFTSRRRKQLRRDTHVIVHRPADIEQQQDLDDVATLGRHFEVKPPAGARGGVDRIGERQLGRRAAACETPQTAQRQFHVARAEFDVVVQIREFPPVPNLDRAAMPRFILADAHSLWIVTVGAVRRRAGRADPFVATLMPALLLIEAQRQGFHQLAPAAQCLDFRHFRGRQALFRESCEPVRGQFPQELREGIHGPLEMRSEGAVESIVVAFVLYQASAREVVKPLGARFAQPDAQRFEQRQELRDRHRHAGAAQRKEESNEHSGG